MQIMFLDSRIIFWEATIQLTATTIIYFILFPAQFLLFAHILTDIVNFISSILFIFAKRIPILFGTSKFLPFIFPASLTASSGQWD